MCARMDFAIFLHDSDHCDNGLPICRPWMLCTARPLLAATAKTVSRDARKW